MKIILLIVMFILFSFIAGSYSISCDAEEPDHDCLSCCGVCHCSYIFQESSIIPLFTSGEVVSYRNTAYQCVFVFEIDHPPKISL